jgi:integrase
MGFASAVVTPATAVVDVGLRHPRPDRLDPIAKLGRDPLHRAVLGAQLRPQRPNQSDRLFLLPRRIPTRRRLPRRDRSCHADRPDHEAIVLLLAYTGVRWGEMAALKVGSVNLMRCRLDIYEVIAEVRGKQVTDTVKNHERRSVPFPDFLVPALSTLMVGKSLNSQIFVGETGQPVRVSTFRPRAFAPAVKRCQVVDPLFPTITPHDLRHTAASLAISAGANPKGVQTMLGHASAAMTLDTYADLFPDDLDAVASALSESTFSENWGQK